MNDIFPKVIVTLNYHNGYHLDLNDRNSPTHGVITIPNSKIPEEEHMGGSFALGNNVFEYSLDNVNLVFSGPGIAHTTNVPYKIPHMPNILRGHK